MTSFIGDIRSSLLDKFKIPTFLGLGIILSGIGAGVYLVMQQQTFLSKAAPDLTAQNITFTNTTENSVAVSWQTLSPTASFVNFGQISFAEQTTLDDRDQAASTGPKPHLTHYATFKNLMPQTKYQFKIISGKLATDILKFTTAKPEATQSGFTPIIGSVLDGDTPLDEGIAYLSISGADAQSALIKPGGNFLIPISQIRKEDLSDIFPLVEGATAKLTIISDKGKATALFTLNPSSIPLPPLRLGQDTDLTDMDFSIPSPSPTVEELNKYDLNSDGKINSADNAIILLNFGKNPKNKRADLNSDKVVDQKDIDLMSPHINE